MQDVIAHSKGYEAEKEKAHSGNTESVGDPPANVDEPSQAAPAAAARRRVVKVDSTNTNPNGSLADLFVAAQRRNAGQRPPKRNYSTPQSQKAPRVHQKRPSPGSSPNARSASPLPAGDASAKSVPARVTAHAVVKPTPAAQITPKLPRNERSASPASGHDARTDRSKASHNNTRLPAVAARTIQAALPVLIEPGSASNARSDANDNRPTPRQPSRVYPAERKRVDADFDRGGRLQDHSLPTEQVDPIKRDAADPLTFGNSAASEERKPAGPARDQSQRSASIIRRANEFPEREPKLPGLPDAWKIDSDDYKRKGSSQRRLSPTRSGANTRERVLFDPHQHNPVNFKQLPKTGDRSNKNQSPRLSERRLHGKASSQVSDVSDDTDFRRSQPAESIREVASLTQSAPRSEGLTLADYASKLYREIVDLEAKQVAENQAKSNASAKPTTEGAPVMGTHETTSTSVEQYWIGQVQAHQKLAELHHEFLLLALQPNNPQSIACLPQMYNITARLWHNVFHLIMERLRHALADATEHNASERAAILTDFLIDIVHYAYIFYTTLLDHVLLGSLRSTWLENLGDLSRYRMAVAGMLIRIARARLPEQEVSKQQVDALARAQGGGRSGDPKKGDDDDNATENGDSIGDAALGGWEVDDTDVWRAQAVEWYSKGCLESPWNGRLFHQLAVLSRGDDLKVAYYCCRSLLAAQPHSASKDTLKATLASYESCDTSLSPSALSLYLHLQNVLLSGSTQDKTTIASRFLEQLEIELLGNRSTIRSRLLPMAVINIAALLGYGSAENKLLRSISEVEKETPPKDTLLKPQAVILGQPILQRRHSDVSERSSEAEGKTDSQKANNDDTSEILRRMRLDDPTDSGQTAGSPDLASACQIAFGMLRVVLRCRPVGTEDDVTPYIVTLLNFLSAIAYFKHSLEILEQFLPWRTLASLFNRIPASVDLRLDGPVKLLGLPLTEDWTIRGSEWSSRLFGRGFWKTNSNNSTRIDSDILPVLETLGEWSLACSIDAIEAAKPPVNSTFSNATKKEAPGSVVAARWKRVAVAATLLAKNSQYVVLDAAARPEQRVRMAPKTPAEPTHTISPALEPLVNAIWAEEVEYNDDLDVVEYAKDRSVEKRQRELRTLMAMNRSQTSARRWASVASNAATPQHHVIFRANKREARRLRIDSRSTILVMDGTLVQAIPSLIAALCSTRIWQILLPMAVMLDLDKVAASSAPLAQSVRRVQQLLEQNLQRKANLTKLQTFCGNDLIDTGLRQRLVSTQSVQGDAPDWVIHTALGVAKQAALNSGNSDEGVCRVAVLTLDKALRVRARELGIDALTDNDIVEHLAGVMPD